MLPCKVKNRLFIKQNAFPSQLLPLPGEFVEFTHICAFGRKPTIQAYHMLRIVDG